jgi:outer membrane protein assembly factor BamD
MRDTRKRLALLLLLVTLILLTSGCAWLKGLFAKRDMSRANPEAIYARGYEDYQEGRYERAVESFQRLKEVYPLSPLAILAEMGIADANFSNKSYGEAEIAYTDFYNLHPTNENIPYVLYQIAMCHFNQMSTIDRDQTETTRARKDFERLIARFPNSKFAFLAQKRLRECRQQLAEHEFYVGEFYFRTKKYRAALRRFEGIARDYTGLGLDYKLNWYLTETKKLAARQEVEEKREKEKLRLKNEKKKAEEREKEKNKG